MDNNQILQAIVYIIMASALLYFAIRLSIVDKNTKEILKK